MALTIRERVIAALYARLAEQLVARSDGTPAVALRRNPGDPQTQPLAVDLFDGGHEPTVGSDTAHTLYELRVELEVFAAAGTDLNELYGRVMDAVAIDRTFGGLATDAFEGGLSAPVPGTVEGHPDVVGAELTILIQFWTLDADVRTASAP